MIVGLFFLTLIAAFGLVAAQVLEEEGARILSALTGRPQVEDEAPARVITVSWQRAEPVRPAGSPGTSRAPLAAAA